MGNHHDVPGSMAGGTVWPTGLADPPIVGSAAGEVIRVEDVVSFTWVPDPGDSYRWSWTDYYWQGEPEWMTFTGSGPSAASGSVSFAGVSSSAAFQAVPASVAFSLSAGWDITGDVLYPDQAWSWAPAAGLLDPNFAFGSWDNWIGVTLASSFASAGSVHWSGERGGSDAGHWALAPDPHDVAVFGRGGDDSIYGGQGRERLSGGGGDDRIWGGIGVQVLDGGAGDDTIQAGSGAQSLLGGGGRDMLWGGTGTQFLQGGRGDDVLHAGRGDQTLSGGAGRDVFAFDEGFAGHQVIDDFRRGQDLIQVARDIHGLALARPQDLVSHVAAAPGGGTVIDLGGGASVTLPDMSLRQFVAHVQDYVRVV